MTPPPRSGDPAERRRRRLNIYKLTVSVLVMIMGVEMMHRLPGMGAVQVLAGAILFYLKADQLLP